MYYAEIETLEEMWDSTLLRHPECEIGAQFRSLEQKKSVWSLITIIIMTVVDAFITSAAGNSISLNFQEACRGTISALLSTRRSYFKFRTFSVSTQIWFLTFGSNNYFELVFPFPPPPRDESTAASPKMLLNTKHSPGIDPHTNSYQTCRVRFLQNSLCAT